MKDWRRVETVWWEEVLMEILTGLWREARVSESSFELMVAEKRYVWRFSRGRTFKLGKLTKCGDNLTGVTHILSMTGPKSRSRILSYSQHQMRSMSCRYLYRSASSMTRYRRFLRENPFVFSR